MKASMRMRLMGAGAILFCLFTILAGTRLAAQSSSPVSGILEGVFRDLNTGNDVYATLDLNDPSNEVNWGVITSNQYTLNATVTSADGTRFYVVGVGSDVTDEVFYSQESPSPVLSFSLQNVLLTGAQIAQGRLTFVASAQTPTPSQRPIDIIKGELIKGIGEVLVGIIKKGADRTPSHPQKPGTCGISNQVLAYGAVAIGSNSGINSCAADQLVTTAAKVGNEADGSVPADVKGACTNWIDDPKVTVESVPYTVVKGKGQEVTVSWGQYVSRYKRTVTIGYYSDAKPDMVVKYVDKTFYTKNYQRPQPSASVVKSCPYSSSMPPPSP